MERLLPFRVKGDKRRGDFNYVLMHEPWGQYLIPDDGTVKSIVRAAREMNCNMGLCERYDDTKNHRTHFDLDIFLSEKKTDITIEDFFELFKSINKILNKYLNMSKSDMSCYVLSRHAFPENVEYKNKKFFFGLHLVYPDVVIPNSFRDQIYDEVLIEASKKNVFSSLPLLESSHPCSANSLRKIIEFPNGPPVMCYGSNKPDKNMYDLRYIVEYNLDVRPVTLDEFSFDDLFDTLKFNTDKPACDLKTSARLRKTADDILMSGGDHRCTLAANDVNFKDVEKFLNMLNRDRASDYHSWIRVGLCLHNISRSDQMLSLFVRFSQSDTDKSQSTDFRRIWSSFKTRDNGGLKIGTLRYWAEKDSPEAFRDFRNEEIDKKLCVTISDDGDTHFDIAEVMHKLYSDRYVCASNQHNLWFEFKNHRWHPIDSGYSLFVKVSTELVDYYKRKTKDLRKKEVEMDDLPDDNATSVQDRRECILQRKKKIEKIIKMLKTTTFKKNLMVECRNLFYREKFMDMLNDKSRHLLCFNNGVYDLDTHEFRDGIPDDCISFSTHINYIKYNENIPEINYAYNIINEMHKTPMHTDYLLSTLAAGLHGVKKNQRMDIWTGVGSNGKSLTVDLLQKSLGDYFFSPSIQLLTTKRRNSSSASPDVMNIKGRRIIVFQEPENDDQIYTGLMKTIFGNDNLTGRYLHQNEVTFKPQASGFLACNDLPNICSQDGGTWRRIKVLDFPYKFVVGEPKANSNEKRGDPSLPDQLEGLAEAFMSMLIHRHSSLRDNAGIIEEPDDVLQSTKMYRSSCDIYEEFLDDFTETSDRPSDIVEWKDMHSAITAWNKEMYRGRNLPKKADMKKQLESKIGKLVDKKFWPGMKLTFKN